MGTFVCELKNKKIWGSSRLVYAPPLFLLFQSSIKVKSFSESLNQELAREKKSISFPFVSISAARVFRFTWSKKEISSRARSVGNKHI